MSIYNHIVYFLFHCFLISSCRKTLAEPVAHKYTESEYIVLLEGAQMDVRDKVVVVTGAGSGIGRALCLRFAAEGAKAVVVSDRDESLARSVAAEVGGISFRTDVSDEQEIKALVHGAIGAAGADRSLLLECGNHSERQRRRARRGVATNLANKRDVSRLCRASRAARNAGARSRLSAANRIGAGLLTQLGSAPYSVTKHAAVGFAEWLAITYHAKGIRVSCLCPQGVRTDMLNQSQGGIAEYLRQTSVSAEQVAESVITGLAAEKFLILPHPEVAEYFLHKAEDYERWLRGMRRLQDQFGVTV